MSLTTLCSSAIFFFLCTAIFNLFRMDLGWHELIKNKKKAQPFKEESFAKKNVAKLIDKQKAVLSSAQISLVNYLTLSAICSVLGFFAGRIIYNSSFIATVIGIFSTFIPFMYFSYRQTKLHAANLEALASSMMIVSNSYIITENIIATVKENIDNLEYPGPFRAFLTYVTLIDTDITAGLRRMEANVSNPYFSQWVNALVQAQKDRAMKYVAVSVVESLHDVLQVQAEAEAKLYDVWQEYFLVLIMIFSMPLIFRFLLSDAYAVMTTSFLGQSLFFLLICSVVFSVLCALKINRPLMV